jgi:hypothetical protein
MRFLVKRHQRDVKLGYGRNRLDLHSIGLAFNWTCIQLDLHSIGLAFNWTCIQLDLHSIGLAFNWTCIQDATELKRRI